jgi:hypothetical protein
MERPTDVSGTQNAYIATRAVLQRIRKHNAMVREGNGRLIHRVLIPGMATGIGCMNVDESAAQMRRAVDEELMEVRGQ